MKTTARQVVTLTLVFVLGVVGAQAAPNFSGQWKMSSAKSDYGPFPAPSSLTRKITHEEPNLHSVTTQSGQRGEVTTELKYTTDGMECTNLIQGAEVKGSAKWDGDVLVVDSKRNIQGAEVSFQERWSLSEDGKTLTIPIHIASPQGEVDLKLVLEKQ